MTPAELKAWRLLLNLSQERAAAALGMTRAGFQRLEYGQDVQTGKATTIDYRTELACLWLLAVEARELAPGAEERCRRLLALGRLRVSAPKAGKTPKKGEAG